MKLFFILQDVIIIVLESQKNEIAQRVSKLPLKLKYDFVILNNDNDLGTAEALSLISERIKSDVLLISCDTITNVDFFPVLNQFRTENASCVALFCENNLENVSSVVIPGPKMKYKQERDLVGINSENNRLLFLASTTDYQDNLPLPGHLLRSYGKITMHSGLTDAHIYLVKRWVINYLAKSDKFSTIKGELLPFIIKKQLSRPSNPVNNMGFSEINFDSNDIFDHVKQNELDQKILETNLNNFGRLKRSNNSELIRCFAHIAPTSSFCIRVNTILNYCIVNKSIFSVFQSLCGSNNAALISRNATVKSTQMSDCAIAENTTISEKTSLKSSIFGTNCLIDQKTRISDSVIMNNVTVEERVVIENSIVCNHATIKKGSILKNCLVGHNFIVQENTVKEKAHLTGEGFMEI